MSHIVAIVPAAGLSGRMGRPKLTLSLRGKSVVTHVIEALLDGGAARVLCVVRQSDDPEAHLLRHDSRNAGAEIILCDPPPPDMRASVEFGIAVLEREPSPPSGILLCPGDSPGISSTLVRRVIDEFSKNPRSIVIPRSANERGHPVAIPWDLARSIRDLPGDTGVNALQSFNPHRRIFLDIADDPSTFADLDTPEDYREWQERLGPPREQS